MVTFILLVVLSTLALANEIFPPAGWELSKCDCSPDSDYSVLDKSIVIADFNGDGLQDSAYLFRKNNSDKGAVFVSFGRESGMTKFHMIDDEPWSMLEYTLTFIKPGKYATPDGQVKLRNTGILLEEVEYGFGAIYWFIEGRWKHIPYTRGSLKEMK